MEILHFEDLGRLAGNAVVLVLGEYQVSIATYLRAGSIYPHIKFARDPLIHFDLSWIRTKGVFQRDSTGVKLLFMLF